MFFKFGFSRSSNTVGASALTFKDILVSFYFFMFYLALSIWLPFYNLYLKDLGFSGTQVGVIAGIFQAALFFVVPVWGMFSDHNGVRKALQIALMMSTLLIFGIRFVHPFFAILAYMMILAFFHHPLGSLLDSLAIHHVHDSPLLSYGGLRVWGSIGWAVGATLMGHYLITHGLDRIFPAAAIFYFITLLATFALGSSDTKVEQERNFSVRRVAAVFGEKRVLFFLILLTLYGVGVSPLYVFINLYYRDIGAENNLIGIAFAVQAMSELPFFFYGQRLVERIGAANLLVAVMGIAVLRLIVYGMVSDPVVAVALGVAQGATLSLFWVGIVHYLHRLIPVEWRATGQSLIWAFHLGAGVTIGNVIIGRLSDFYRMQEVMKLAALFTLGVMVMLFFYFKLYGRDESRQN